LIANKHIREFQTILVTMRKNTNYELFTKNEHADSVLGWIYFDSKRINF